MLFDMKSWNFAGLSSLQEIKPNKARGQDNIHP